MFSCHKKSDIHLKGKRDLIRMRRTTCYDECFHAGEVYVGSKGLLSMVGYYYWNKYGR